MRNVYNVLEDMLKHDLTDMVKVLLPLLNPIREEDLKLLYGCAISRKCGDIILNFANSNGYDIKWDHRLLAVNYGEVDITLDDWEYIINSVINASAGSGYTLYSLIYMMDRIAYKLIPNIIILDVVEDIIEYTKTQSLSYYKNHAREIHRILYELKTVCRSIKGHGTYEFSHRIDILSNRLDL